MKTTAEIADEAMKAFTLIDADQGESADVEEISARFIREQIIAALDADRAQQPTSLLYDSRDWARWWSRYRPTSRRRVSRSGTLSDSSALAGNPDR